MAAAHTKGFFSRNRSKVTRWLRATNQTANFTLSLPANYRVKAVYVAERGNAAVTGGLRVGTAAAGTQVVTALAVAALSNNFIAATAIPVISQAVQTLYIEAVTAWVAGATVDVKIECEEIAYN